MKEHTSDSVSEVVAQNIAPTAEAALFDTNWDDNEEATRRKSEKRAWVVAGVAGAISVIEAIALASLIPLHQPVPYVLQANEATGKVEVARSLKDPKTTWDEITKKADLRKYVRNRESYSRALATQYYSTTFKLSGPLESEKWQKFFNPKLNKEGTSPLTKYGDGGSVEIKVKSVSLASKNTATVNYVRISRLDQLPTTKPESTEWVATITYNYGMPPENEDDRELNPTGFQVTEYRNDPVDPTVNEVK